MTTKRKAATKRQNGPIRLNLNLRTRGNEKNAPWKHYQGLSFICEARDTKQAEEFATLLKESAMALALKMKLAIPGAIYIQSGAASGPEERTAEANPA